MVQDALTTLRSEKQRVQNVLANQRIIYRYLFIDDSVQVWSWNATRFSLLLVALSIPDFMNGFVLYFL